MTIYSVTEWRNNAAQAFFFDDSRVDQTAAFEVAYATLCKRASEMPNTTLNINVDPTLIVSVKERFGTYHDGAQCWKKLLTRPPCRIDRCVTLVLR